MTTSPWFDKNGLMSPFGENGILFRAENDELNFRETGNKDLNSVNKALNYVFYGDFWRDSPTTQEKWSHDNHKAVICMSKRNGLDYHKRMYWKDFHKMLHPKDLILFAWATGRWYSWLALPFLWFTTFNMVLTCLQDDKIRPKLWERIKNGFFLGKLERSFKDGHDTVKQYRSRITGKTYSIRYILKADGKLLAWLLLSTFNMPITKKLCNWAIKFNKDFGSWRACFDIYFKDPAHPNRNFSEKAYEL